MARYYNIVGTQNGIEVVLYGSFIKEDCEDEIDCERDNWKEDRITKIKIKSVITSDSPDPEIY